MYCTKCGTPISQTESICPNCRAEYNIRVLTKEEKNSFNGITIEQNDGFSEENRQQQEHQYNKHFYWQINTGNSRNIIWQLLAGMLIIAGLVFFLVPVILFIGTIIGLGLLANLILGRKRRFI